MEYINEYIIEVWNLVLEMAPWLLLGLIFAGALKVYFPQKHIDKYMGKSNFKSALNASVLGIPMPLCSCGVIPTGISFYKNGASNGATNSFLISTPQTGVDSILATYSMLGWPFALLRPFVALVTGVAGGIFTNVFVKSKNTAAKSTPNPYGSFQIDTAAVSGKEACDDNCACEETAPKQSQHSAIRAARYAFVELLQDIAQWLIIGFLIAALISVLIPDDFFSRFQGLGLIELLIVLAASIPIYVCATGSIPIAAVLLMKGVSPGAALVFLMAGPATNVATITVLGKTMGRKSLTVYLTTITLGAVLFGLLTNWLLPVDFILSKVPHLHPGHDHEMVPYWLQILSAVVLLVSMAGGYFINKYNKSKTMKQETGTTLKVQGMTCSHCEANVKRNLEKLEGIERVEADNGQNRVVIFGDGFDTNQVKKVVEELGYRYKG